MAEVQNLIGIDVGTTAVKGGLFGSDGQTLAHESLCYPTIRSRHNWVEQDPAEWIRAIDRILTALFKNIAAESVAAVGLVSQVNTHVFVDRDGKALLPAIVWQDGRASAEAERLDAAIDPSLKQKWWGAPLPVDASHALSRMAWVAAHYPDIWEQTAFVLSPKDYCLMHYTGEVVSDPVSSIGLVDLEGRYIPDFLALVPGAMDRLPPLRPFDQTVGQFASPAIPGLKATAVAGTMDAWANLFGSGVCRIGEGAYFSGTSEIIALVSDKRPGAEGVISFLPWKNWHVHAGPTQSGGDSLRWFAECVKRPIEEVLAEAAAVGRRRQRLLFLPHLQGERAPLWDPYSRGSFLGIDSDTGVGDMALAVLEGVACSARLLFDSVSAAAGRSYGCLYLGGGGSRSDLWCQIRADMLGVTLQRLAFLDTGVLGAAIMAGVGTGIFTSLQEASGNMVRVERNFQPNPDYAHRYQAFLDDYGKAYEALKPLYRQMDAGADGVT